MLIVYIPTPSKEVATALAKHLLEQKLIACGNIFKSTSIYLWEGSIKEEDEWVLVCKTLGARERVERAVVQEHPYECPCVLFFSAEANEEYTSWVKDVVQ